MTTFLQESRLLDQDKSAAWKLFTYRYLCKVKQIHITPDWVFSHYGVVSSGDSAIDKESMNGFTEVYLRPVDMAMMIGNGVDIRVVTPADCVTIYEIITQHLHDWVHALENNPHINKGPVADLKLFDELATVVWHVARHYIKVEIGTSHLMARLNSFYVNPLGGRGIVKSTAEVEPEHDSMASDIIRLTTRRKRAWEQ